jgi:hypothetical protein
MLDAVESPRTRTGFRNRLFCVALAIASCCAAAPVSAQWMGKQTGCYASEMDATPNRPTVSNTAHVTQYGVLELEYGWDRIWPEKEVRDTSAGGMLKFGMLCDIEVHWITTSFLSHVDQTGT